MKSGRDDARRLRWEARTRVPFLVLAFVYLVAWTVVAVDGRQLSTLSIVFAFVLLAIWLTFIVDYLVRLRLAANRGKFVLGSLPDLIAALLPALRPVVQLRYLSSIPFFRARTGTAQRLRIAIFAVAFTVIFLYTIALAVFVAERFARGAVITTFGDSLWWACVTMFTVGYGDYYPVTPIGRIWAVVLMVGGVAIIGVASAIVVSYLNERIRQPLAETADLEPASFEQTAIEPSVFDPADDDGAAPEGTTPPKGV